MTYLPYYTMLFILVSMGDAVRKVTINVPVKVLERAQKATGKGITATVLEGLNELTRRQKRSALRALRGNVEFELNLHRVAVVDSDRHFRVDRFFQRPRTGR